MRYAIIDVETTGALARMERIAEIAIVVHDGTKIIDTFSTLINPERSIPWNITYITGITDDMVANAPKFYQVARKILELTEDAIFVAHNVSFDYSFVREEFARLGYTFSKKQLCTVRLTRKIFPGLPSYSLSYLKNHFNIHAERSHRALDDALATVVLFEKILAQQSSATHIKDFVHKGIRESKLPAGMTIERLHQLPESCGVYYLHDQHGEVIYVGKSLNIKNRVFEHFADHSPKGEKMRDGVAEFSWEVTGSELVALLLESAEIKRLQPRINRAQRTRHFSGGLFAYTNPQGYLCLAAGKLTAANLKKLQLVADYPKPDSAKSHLDSIARHFELCTKLCHLDDHAQACFNYYIKKCRGACLGVELPHDYNVRVEMALAQLKNNLEGSFFILDEGRTPSEKAIVAVRNGKYLGFGYFDTSTSEGFTPEDLLECVSLPHPDPEAPRIIRNFLEGKKKKQILNF